MKRNFILYFFAIFFVILFMDVANVNAECGEDQGTCSDSAYNGNMSGCLSHSSCGAGGYPDEASCTSAGYCSDIGGASTPSGCAQYIVRCDGYNEFGDCTVPVYAYWIPYGYQWLQNTWTPQTSNCGSALCGDSNAKNFVTPINPPDYQDNNTCHYCNETPIEADCIDYYCGDEHANNADVGGSNCASGNRKICYRNDQLCTYTEYKYCGNVLAKNADFLGAACIAAHGEHCTEDYTTCDFCTNGDTDPFCTVYFCGDMGDPTPPPAQNAMTHSACVQAHTTAFDSKTCVRDDENICTYQGGTYCDDPEANNYDQDGTLCQAAHPKGVCTGTNLDPVCAYDAVYFCNDVTDALNGQTQADCETDNSPRACIADNAARCEYPMCLLGLDMPINCPSGNNFDIEYAYAYIFHPSYESCIAPTDAELLKWQEYFTSLLCVDTVPVIPPVDNKIDWCPEIEGTQSDPLLCVDVCPNDAGNQSNESQCTDMCLNIEGIQPVTPESLIRDSDGNCNQVGCTVENPYCKGCPTGKPNCHGGTSGRCGSANHKTVQPGTVRQGDYITNGCLAGNPTKVNISGNSITWACNHIGSGTDESCSATLGTCDFGYCEKLGRCLSSADEKCNPVEEDADNNDVIKGKKGSVVLDKLKVSPLVNVNTSCTVTWADNTVSPRYSAFERYSSNTRCTLSSQDQTLTTFQPNDPLQTTVTSRSYIVKKDTSYTLSCMEGSDVSTLQSVSGVCRVNTSAGEFN